VKRKKLKVLKREDRTCGGCNACCSVLAISDLKKKAGVDCVHLDRTKSEHHCTIYETRPRDCSEYTCGWVRNVGFGDDEHRPDKVGVLFTPRDNKWEVAPFAGPFTLIAHETREGAFEEPEAQKLMTYIAGRFIILAFWGPTLTKCRTMGPANKIKAVIEWCQEHGYPQLTGILDGARPSFDHFTRRLV
jgi:hypothetical protein